MKNIIRFKSKRFRIHESEEEWTNPGCFGKELADWLCLEMKSIGYQNAEVIPEDFGWCVMCLQETFMLWIGCTSLLSNQFSDTAETVESIDVNEIIWSTFTVAEIPFFDLKLKFLKLIGRISPIKAQTKLHEQLKKILLAQREISIVEES